MEALTSSSTTPIKKNPSYIISTLPFESTKPFTIHKKVSQPDLVKSINFSNERQSQHPSSSQSAYKQRVFQSSRESLSRAITTASESNRNGVEVIPSPFPSPDIQAYDTTSAAAFTTGDSIRANKQKNKKTVSISSHITTLSKSTTPGSSQVDLLHSAPRSRHSMASLINNTLTDPLKDSNPTPATTTTTGKTLTLKEFFTIRAGLSSSQQSNFSSSFNSPNRPVATSPPHLSVTSSSFLLLPNQHSAVSEHRHSVDTKKKPQNDNFLLSRPPTSSSSHLYHDKQQHLPQQYLQLSKAFPQENKRQLLKSSQDQTKKSPWIKSGGHKYSVNQSSSPVPLYEPKGKTSGGGCVSDTHSSPVYFDDHHSNRTTRREEMSRTLVDRSPIIEENSISNQQSARKEATLTSSSLQSFGDVHDIFGSFNERLSNIRDHLSEAINVDMAFAKRILSHFFHEKSQARIISDNAIENSLASISLALTHLDFFDEISEYTSSGGVQRGQHVPESITKEGLDRSLRQLAGQLMNGSITTSVVIQVEAVILYAEFNKETSNFTRALRLFKHAKNMAIQPMSVIQRMKAFKSMGECYCSLKQTPLARVAYGKYLEHAWYLSDVDSELDAYECLGVTHYLLGDIETAKLFHEKMLWNDLEPRETSISLKLGVKRVTEQLRKLNAEPSRLSLSSKKVASKIFSGDFENHGQDDEDLGCSSDEDEFKIALPKTLSQEKNRNYQAFLDANINTSPERRPLNIEDQEGEEGEDHSASSHRRGSSSLANAQERKSTENRLTKMAKEIHRFVAIYNSEDKVYQQALRVAANQEIRKYALKTYEKRAMLTNPLSKKPQTMLARSLHSANKQNTSAPIRQQPLMTQFSINRNLDNYLQGDRRLQAVHAKGIDVLRMIDDPNEKVIRHRVFLRVHNFHKNLYFAQAIINAIFQKDKSQSSHHKHERTRRFAISSVSSIYTKTAALPTKDSDEQIQKRKIKTQDISKPNSIRESFKNIARYQMMPEVDITVTI